MSTICFLPFVATVRSMLRTEERQRGNADGPADSTAPSSCSKPTRRSTTTAPHTGHVLTYDQGRNDAKTWADYINVGMEHGAFDMTGLEEYMRGLLDGGPTRSGHLHADGDRRGAGQRHRRAERRLQRLAVPPDPGARRPRHPALPGRDRPMRSASSCAPAASRITRPAPTSSGSARRGRGSEPTAAPIWGLDPDWIISIVPSRGRSTPRASFCSV